ncbi:MAG: hypothetical protein LBS04_05515 [Tannerellaceae bacterium]|jgi:hypothetical protein|nr:hypothetical protein [Tannerellaceae bacterium]
MKKIYYSLLLVLLASSCWETGGILPDDGRKDPSESMKIKFTVENGNGNIVELMTFNLFSETDFTLHDLTEAYDSIVWKVSGIPGSFSLFGHEDSRTDTYEIHVEQRNLSANPLIY